MRCGDFRVSYVSDEAIFQGLFVKFWLAVFGLFMLILPLVAAPDIMDIACQIGIAIIAAVGLNLLTGFTGQISLGHAAIMGVGGYTAAILIFRLNVPFLLAIPAAGFSSAVIGVIIGIPSLRIKGLYLAIATLAAQVILDYVFIQWEGLTGGIRGITIGAPVVFGMELKTENQFFYLILACAFVMVFFARNLVRTRVGRAFVAIRDRDLAAEIMGISLYRYKLTAFAISSFYAGVAGALILGFRKVITPEHFPLMMSIEYLAMVIVGGLGSILGAIFGAIFMTFIPQMLTIIATALQGVWPGMTEILAHIKDIVFGALIVVFLIFEPHGLNAIWGRVKAAFRLWPFSY